MSAEFKREKKTDTVNPKYEKKAKQGTLPFRGCGPSTPKTNVSRIPSENKFEAFWKSKPDTSPERNLFCFFLPEHQNGSCQLRKLGTRRCSLVGSATAIVNTVRLRMRLSLTLIPSSILLFLWTRPGPMTESVALGPGSQKTDTSSFWLASFH